MLTHADIQRERERERGRGRERERERDWEYFQAELVAAQKWLLLFFFNFFLCVYVYVQIEDISKQLVAAQKRLGSLYSNEETDRVNLEDRVKAQVFVFF